MAENRLRLQVVLKPETHERLRTKIPRGLRSGLFDIIATMVLDAYEREGMGILPKLQSGQVYLTSKD